MNIMKFQIISKREIRNEIPDSSRFELSEKLLFKRLALSKAKDSTSIP